MRQYQYLLIQKAVAACGYSVANGITHSTLKNRINMMLTNKKTNRASWLKLLAMLPIVGTALALNAETVNDYVYEDTQEQPQKKVVKKGRKAAQVKLNDKTIEVKEAKAEETPQAVSEPKLIIDGKVAAEPQQEIIKMSEVLGDREPLLVIDGKVTKPEQMNAINPKEIDNVSVIKNEDVLKEYAKHFNADTSNGIIFINTKEYVKNGKKELVSATVKAKEPQEDHPMAFGTIILDTPETENAFNVVEQMPQFPGGEVELMKFLNKNVKYPVAAMKAGTQGRVVAQFIVETDGSITNVKVLKKVSDEIDAEAVRVINAMPKWKPGMQNGKVVRVKYTIPVTFRLS
ncbi:MAG: TonB family protein [Prevotella sp.]|nr:TonB family protein [Prevotella sp.]